MARKFSETNEKDRARLVADNIIKMQEIKQSTDGGGRGDRLFWLWIALGLYTVGATIDPLTIASLDSSWGKPHTNIVWIIAGSASIIVTVLAIYLFWKLFKATDTFDKVLYGIGGLFFVCWAVMVIVFPLCIWK